MEVFSAGDGPTAMDDFNQTQDPTTLGHCLHRMLESAVDRHVDSVAVVCHDRRLTYGQLNTLANRFARVLAEQGVARGHVVGVALDRSADLLVVLLAVLKTGAAYLAIDPGFPAGRIRRMLDDAGPRLVVADASAPHVASCWQGACLDAGEAWSRAGSVVDGGNLAVGVESDDLAYVIYTSGSTGRPKGVAVSHGAVCNLLLSMQREPGCGQADRLLAAIPVTFDMAVPDLYLALLSGGTTVFAQAHQAREADALLWLMDRYDVTMMQGTPTTWQMLWDAGWRGRPRLSSIICGGEALPRRLADRLLGCADAVWNAYGPTEATVYASIWRVVRGEDPVIGSPVVNARLYVLDADLSPAPLGSPGELFIRGAGVARGY